jgi:proline dehydrogenase
MFLARRFVAGITAEEALPKVLELNRRGIKATMTVLGESVTKREESLAARDEFIHLLDLIRDQGADSNISVKLTQLGLDIDEQFCFDNTARVLEKAAEGDNFVRIDMEAAKYTQPTLDMLDRLREVHPNVGVVIQSMLFRSREDVRNLIAKGVGMRLCKGAYKFPASIAHLKKEAIAEAFRESAAEMLVSGIYHGFATHDESLVRWILDFVKREGVDPAAFEFQMLYGMRGNRQARLAADGYNVRCYVPYGTHWFPYFSRRLRERKENVFFVLRNLFTQD